MPTRCPEKYACIFVFLSKTFFFNISISRGRTGERKVSSVLTRCHEQYVSIFVFRSKKISSISRFLEVAQIKGRYQRYQRFAVKGV